MDPSPWSWDPAWGELTILVAIGASYGVALRRYPASSPRVACFAAGLLLMAGVLVSPVSTLALHYLLSAHLFQNVALAEWAPLLLVIGVPPALAALVSRPRPLRWLTHPLVALPLWLATYGVWHIPVVYDAALRNHALLHLEHACYVVAGLLLWWPVFQDAPHDVPSGRRAAYAFAAFILGSPVGLLLTLLPEPVYAFYEEAPRLWGLSALTDQQIGGMLMAGTEAIVFFGVFAAFLLRFFHEEGAV